MLRRSSFLLMVLLAGSLMLSACGSDDESTADAAKDNAKAGQKPEEEKAEKKPPAPAMPICPQVAVVRELDTISNTKDNGTDPAQLIAGAKMLNVTGDCSYGDDGDIDLAFTVNIVAKRGPRLDGLHASFPYFVAVVDPEGNIMNKMMFKTEISFSSDEPFNNAAEPVHVVIPLAKDKFITGPYYRVLSGFQLTAEQVAASQKVQK